MSSHVLVRPKLRPTVVFDTYWRFACERQLIFFRRLARQAKPWTADPILSRYRFTNAFRASDRVSQYLISSVIAKSDKSADDVFFRVLLFKTFNRIETWEWLEACLGALHLDEFSVGAYNRVLDMARAVGRSLYSAAYIMPNPPLGRPQKHTNHLLLIRKMSRDKLGTRIAEASSLESAFHELRTYPSIGPFLAYQYVIDLNYSPLLDFSEADFVAPGPGALEGIARCFCDLDGASPEYVIRATAEMARSELERLGLRFPTLWGRDLQLIDHQNLFCEVAKYARVAHPEANRPGLRQRIKQGFTPNIRPLPLAYPAKWQLTLNHSFVERVLNLDRGRHNARTPRSAPADHI